MGRISYALFRTSTVNVKVAKRGFYNGAPGMVHHLETVGKTFLKGYHSYLRKGDFDYMNELESSLPEEYQGFAYEGAGMGIEIMDFFRPTNKKQLSSIISGKAEHHIYMMTVGAGWAYARLPIHPEKAMQKLDPLFKWLAIDGYGFHQAYFKTNRYVRHQKLPKHLSEYGCHVFYQGVGRCLWFIECGDPSRIFTTIQFFKDEYHGDLWSGVGLACAYAGGVAQEKIQTLKTLGEKYMVQMGQGAAFAAKARLKAGNPTAHTSMACQQLTGCTAEHAAKITDECLPDMKEESEVPKYELWRERIRAKLEHHIKRNTSENVEPQKIIG